MAGHRQLATNRLGQGRILLGSSFAGQAVWSGLSGLHEIMNS